MQQKSILQRVHSVGVLALLLLTTCVEPIEFNVPPAQLQTVVEGVITTDPGPYTVKVSSGMTLNSDSAVPAPIENAKIKLYDDQGNVEDFSESLPGTYQTGGIIRGQVGRSYHIRIETADGKIIESEPDMLSPGGQIDEIKFEFEARKVQVGDYELPNDVFNIFVDGTAQNVPGLSTENFVRWRFTGTYEVITYPELHMTKIPNYTPFKDPPPCSGYIVVEGVPGGFLEKVGDCTCCTCWARHFESQPQLSDTQLVNEGLFNNIKVGEVPVNNATFYKKYLVQVEQMSLSRKAFEYFKMIRSQKEGAANIFQPPSGEIRGNVHAINSSDPVIGLFWASSVSTKSIFIQKSDLPYPVTPITFSTAACYDYYPNSSTEKPTLWE